jgi:mono/diheme cytochrome c family protein
VVLTVYATDSVHPDTAAVPPENYAEAIADGSRLYAQNCAVCHGKTGGGIEEARLSFPPGERRCTRCHRPSNRVVQPLSEPLVDNDMFSLGTPPALHASPERPQPLASTASAIALWAYLSATMPRYEPGRQSQEEYWLLTAFLLDMNGRTAEAQVALAHLGASGLP